MEFPVHRLTRAGGMPSDTMQTFTSKLPSLGDVVRTFFRLLMMSSSSPFFSLPDDQMDDESESLTDCGWLAAACSMQQPDEDIEDNEESRTVNGVGDDRPFGPPPPSVIQRKTTPIPVLLPLLPLHPPLRIRRPNERTNAFCSRLLLLASPAAALACKQQLLPS